MPIIVGCSNYEFVYHDGYGFNDFLLQTSNEVVGDDSAIIKSFINKSNKDIKAPIIYKLSIVSSKAYKNLVIENDQTASTIEVRYRLEYNLYNEKKKCKVYEESIETSANYKSKSAGFNFASDLSRGDISEEIIEKNINQFLKRLQSKKNTFGCINEG